MHELQDARHTALTAIRRVFLFIFDRWVWTNVPQGFSADKSRRGRLLSAVLRMHLLFYVVRKRCYWSCWDDNRRSQIGAFDTAARARYSQWNVFVKTVCVFLHPGGSLLSAPSFSHPKITKKPQPKNSEPSAAPSSVSKPGCDWMIFLTCLSKRSSAYWGKGEKKKKHRDELGRKMSRHRNTFVSGIYGSTYVCDTKAHSSHSSSVCGSRRISMCRSGRFITADVSSWHGQHIRPRIVRILVLASGHTKMSTKMCKQGRNF